MKKTERAFGLVKYLRGVREQVSPRYTTSALLSSLSFFFDEISFTRKMPRWRVYIYIYERDDAVSLEKGRIIKSARCSRFYVGCKFSDEHGEHTLYKCGPIDSMRLSDALSVGRA